jgi:acyl carrier protein
LTKSAGSILANAVSTSVRADESANFSQERIVGVVQRLLAEHSIEREFAAEQDLRDVGLTSLDMASLILSVEAEFDLMIPERHITPANFRSVSTISALVTALIDSKASSAAR